MKAREKKISCQMREIPFSDKAFSVRVMTVGDKTGILLKDFAAAYEVCEGTVIYHQRQLNVEVIHLNRSAVEELKERGIASPRTGRLLLFPEPSIRRIAQRIRGERALLVHEMLWGSEITESQSERNEA